MREIKYSPQLDGLRAICIIFTIFNHIKGSPSFINGTAGVDVFFALSGFLITGILLRSDWTDLKGYYIRRFHRILPVYYLSLIITVALAIVLFKLNIGDPKIDQLSSILLPSMFVSRELAHNAPTLFGQAWTVGIEEKFYLAWPVLFLLLGSNKARLFFLMAIIVLLFEIGNEFFLRGYAGIALGTIAAIFYFRWGFFANEHYGFSLMLAAYLVCILSDLWCRNLLISISAAIFIPALYARESFYSRALSNKYISFIGRLTFSIYMFHVLIINAVELSLRHFRLDAWYIIFFIAYPTTVLTAWLIYKYYENPLIARGKKLAARKV
ncbi:acyltransferase family protein [Cupriavidus sp. USMAHM13]|uniref:acyltransferase family protein n=1 Tax=Cupriavidus sp. USMAHM13 TaxID=1389192 RepID=UPI0009F3B70F|nr:acyltransferase [Cupriavidus sp. USMAHM13]